MRDTLRRDEKAMDSWADRLRGAAGPAIGIALVVLLLAVTSPAGFFTTGNLRTLLAQNAGLIIAVVGMTFVIVAGGIDLSVGSVAALASVTTGLALRGGMSPLLAALVGVATGLLVGLVNGELIARWRLNPFIATLATMGIARGFAKWAASNQTVRASPGWLESLTLTNPRPSWLVVAPSVWVACFVAVLAAIVLRKTIFGVHTTAIGSNEATARLCGVRVERTKRIVYAISGLCAGIAGTLLYARLTVGDPTGAIGMELQVVAAVVIGGASLSGGEGTILGTVLGALLLSVMANGCSLLGISNAAQEMLTGAIIVAPVAIDAWRHRRG